MSNYLASDTDLTSVANAIRTKGGTSAQLAFPAGFVQAIADIPSGGGGLIKSTATFVNTASERVVHHNTGLTFGTDSFCMIVKPSASALATMQADTSTTFYAYCIVLFSNFFADNTIATPRGTVRSFDNQIYVASARGSVGNASAFSGFNKIVNGTNSNQVQYESGNNNGVVYPNVEYEITILEGQVG